jgi:hypothetical protein
VLCPGSNPVRWRGNPRGAGQLDRVQIRGAEHDADYQRDTQRDRWPDPVSRPLTMASHCARDAIGADTPIRRRRTRRTAINSYVLG